MDPLSVVLQLLWGWAVKHLPVLAAWPNRLIPVFNFILSVLVQLGQGAAHADTGSTLKTVGGWLWGVLGPALLNTVIATGIFSGAKNIHQHATAGKTPA